MNRTICNALLCVIVSTIHFSTVASELSDKVCQHSRECGYCGYCVFTKTMETKKEKKWRCLYPFEGVFHLNGKCGTKLLCESDTCRNNGKCTQGFGFYTPRCFCQDTKFYGNNCDKNKIPGSSIQDYATGIAVYFKKNVKDTQFYTINIYVTTLSSGRDLQFVVETSEGFIGRFGKKTGKCVNSKVRLNPYKDEKDCRSEERCYIYLHDCRDVYAATVSFPYKSPLIPSVFKVDGSMAAYEAWIKITVSNIIPPSRIAVFEHEYPLVVGSYSYELYSRIIVKLKYCSKLFRKRDVYFRRTAIRFSAVVEPLESKMKVAWTVWKAMWTEGALRVKFSYNDKLVWSLEPFELPIGNYKVRVEVSKIYEMKLVSNFAECYFEVRVQPIVATIDGGQVRTVSRHDELRVSAENSYDPNRHRSNQNHLRFSWQCKTPGGHKCDHLFPSTSISFTIPPEYLTADKTYIYTVTVSVTGLRPVSASQVVYVFDFSVSIHCSSNCFTKTDPTEELLLRAILSSKEVVLTKFDWTYKIKHESENWYLADVFQDKSYPLDTLCVKPDSLEGGKTYLFRVLTEYRARILTSVIEVNVARKPANGSCTVYPLRGVIDETLFTINCSGFVIDDAVLTYEYFDMKKSEGIFNRRIFGGRMLASNLDGTLDNVHLTRGTVVVLVYTTYGYPVVFQYDIELSPTVITRGGLVRSVMAIHRSLEVGRIQTVLRKISVIPDIVIMPNSLIRTSLWNLYKALVDLESKVAIKDDGDMKMGLSSIRNVIETFVGKGSYTPSFFDLKTTMKENKRLSELFRLNLVTRYSELYISRLMLSKLACTFIYLVELLFVKNNKGFLLDKTDLKNVNYRSMQDTSIFAEEIFNDITFAISFRQDYGLKPYSETTVSGLSEINSQSDSPSKLASEINSADTFRSKMTPGLVKTLEVFSRLTVFAITTKINPFLAEEHSVSTKLMSLSLYGNQNLKSDMVRLTSLEQPIDIFLDTVEDNFGELTLVTKQLDPTISESVLDTEITVIRIDLPERSKLFVEFLLQRNTSQLRVSIDYDVRPSYESVVRHSTVITSSSPTYDVHYIANDHRNFVYMGVLPAPNTPVGETVEFTVRFYSHLCLARTSYQWNPMYCAVGHLTNKSIVHCRCTHLSFFAASIIIPPNKIDPFKDFELFLTVKDNPSVVIYILCLMIIFLLLCIWALTKDRKDCKMRKIYVLGDNFPCDTNLYIVAIFTGNRLFGGTKANVGMRIEGSERRSRSHILKISGHKVLRKNSESWFLIKTSDHLGEIMHIYIWHDNSGYSPSWYCDKILVYDLNISTVYTFFVEQWFAVGFHEYAEAVLFPATASDFRNVRRIALDNIIRELQYFHIFGRIMSNNIHNRMTRLDRVIIFITSFMLANLFSIAFFNAHIESNVGTDEPNFYLETKYIYLSLQVFALTLLVSICVEVLFQKTYDRSEASSGSRSKKLNVYVRPSTKKRTPKRSKFLRLFQQGRRNKINTTLYQHFVRILLKSSKPMKFLPITLSESYSTKSKRNRKLYTLAFTFSVITIFLSFYFVVLYGLKMGREQSNLWLSTLIWVLMEQHLLLSPIKGFVVAIVLASQFQYLTPVSSYNIKVQDTSEEVEHDYAFYYSLLEVRKHPMYHPLSNAQIEIFRKKKEGKRIIFKGLEFFIVVIFSLIIIKVCNIYWSSSAVYSNLHVKKMVAGGLKQNIVNFPNIFNRSQLENFLQYLFGDSDIVYNRRWYNGLALEPPEYRYVTLPGSWAGDFFLSLLGTPTLRQVRVMGNACRLPTVFENASLECIPEWSPDVEDSCDYDYRWSTSTWEQEKRKRTIWEYSGKDISVYSSRGPTGNSYPYGGYVAKLSLAKSKVRLFVIELISSRWIDYLTRVLFVDFTLYNVNRNSFIHVSLIAEQLPYGVVLTTTLTESVQLQVFEIFWTASFSLIILLLLVKDFIEISLYGLLKYLLKIENVYQLLLTCLGIASIVLFITHGIRSARYINDFNFHVVENIFVFSKIINFLNLSLVFSMALFCCLVIRLLSLFWLFGHQFVIIYKALIRRAIHVIVIFLIVLVSTFLHQVINYLLNNFSRRSTSLVASFIALEDTKYIKTTTSYLASFVWNRLLFALIIILMIKTYRQIHLKQTFNQKNSHQSLKNLCLGH